MAHRTVKAVSWTVCHCNSSHGHLVTSEHCTKLWVGHTKLCRRGG